MLSTWRYLPILLFVFCPISFASAEVDKVLVDKSARLLFLLSGTQVVRQYDISLGENPVGHKRREGDEKTPEGNYVLDFKNSRSRYFRSIRISYPNEHDKTQARRSGYSPGGNIFIHGLPNWVGSLGSQFSGRDWTDGCIAVNDNTHMSEIWNLLKEGTPIEIVQ